MRLRVTQKQERPAVFRMPLELELKVNGAARREVVQVNAREQTFTFKLDARPQALALDPNEWVLKELRLKEE